jgi:hypothetical protein
LATYGEKIRKEISQVDLSLRNLVISGYSQDAIRDHVIKAATTIELFLKRDVFPLKSNRDNFASFIDELKHHILDASLIDRFHDIRLLYNTAKHDPSRVIDISKAVEKISALIPVVEEISRLSLGQTGAPVRSLATRIFWICGWDHYVNGETEVAVFLPSEYDGFLGAHSLDEMFIKIREWDTFTAELPLFGQVHSYQDWIPKGQSEFWLSQRDCLPPLVFEGEYKSLLSCLAKYEGEAKDKWPGMNRTDSSQNLFQSCILASLDLAAVTTSELSAEVENIVKITNTQYAVPPSENERAERFVSDIVNLISQVPKEFRSVLTGPFWVTPEELKESEVYSINLDIHTAIDKSNRVLLGVRRL